MPFDSPPADDDRRVGIAADSGVQHRRARRVGGARSARRHARLEDQLCQLPAVERQLEHLLVRDHLPDAGVTRLDQRRAALDRDGLLELTELEHNGERWIRADLQDDAGLHVRAESLERRLEPVRADRQVLQHVRSGLVGHCRAGQPGVGLGRR